MIDKTVQYCVPDAYAYARQHNSRPEWTHLWLLQKGSSLFLAAAGGNLLQNWKRSRYTRIAHFQKWILQIRAYILQLGRLQRQRPKKTGSCMRNGHIFRCNPYGSHHRVKIASFPCSIPLCRASRKFPYDGRLLSCRRQKKAMGSVTGPGSSVVWNETSSMWNIWITNLEKNTLRRRGNC